LLEHLKVRLIQSSELHVAGHKGGSYTVTLDDEFLYSSGLDKLVKKWNMQSGKLETVFKGFRRIA
jgi:hypothetical protein